MGRCEGVLAIGGHGGTGRRAGFRIQCRKAWRFEPSCPHQDRNRRDSVFGLHFRDGYAKLINNDGDEEEEYLL